MRAVVLYEYGDVDKLQLENDQQEPPFGANEVRVRVRADVLAPIPIARMFRLEDVRQAQNFAEKRHPGGKVLIVA